MAKKKCKGCKKRKSLDDFYALHKSPDGKQPRCKECDKKRMKSYRDEANRTGKMDYAEKNYVLLRLEVLSHYSGGKPKCACCSDGNYEFLSIDHIEGGGRKHRLEVKSIYRWLKRNNFPEGFRVLCHSCNQSIGAYGYCPHTTPSRFAALYAQATQAGSNSCASQADLLSSEVDSAQLWRRAGFNGDPVHACVQSDIQAYMGTGGLAGNSK